VAGNSQTKLADGFREDEFREQDGDGHPFGLTEDLCLRAIFWSWHVEMQGRTRKDDAWTAIDEHKSATLCMIISPSNFFLLPI